MVLGGGWFVGVDWFGIGVVVDEGDDDGYCDFDYDDCDVQGQFFVLLVDFGRQWVMWFQIQYDYIVGLGYVNVFDLFWCVVGFVG